MRKALAMFIAVAFTVTSFGADSLKSENGDFVFSVTTGDTETFYVAPKFDTIAHESKIQAIESVIKDEKLKEKKLNELMDSVEKVYAIPANKIAAVNLPSEGEITAKPACYRRWNYNYYHRPVRFHYGYRTCHRVYYRSVYYRPVRRCCHRVRYYRRCRW